jgi:hypothetical protein
VNENYSSWMKNEQKQKLKEFELELKAQVQANFPSFTKLVNL